MVIAALSSSNEYIPLAVFCCGSGCRQTSHHEDNATSNPSRDSLHNSSASATQFEQLQVHDTPRVAWQVHDTRKGRLFMLIAKCSRHRHDASGWTAGCAFFSFKVANKHNSHPMAAPGTSMCFSGRRLTCGEADVCRPPDQPEGGDPKGAQEGQGNDHLLVSEPALAHHTVKLCLHECKPWHGPYLQPHMPLSMQQSRIQEAVACVSAVQHECGISRRTPADRSVAAKAGKLLTAMMLCQ